MFSLTIFNFPTTVAPSYNLTISKAPLVRIAQFGSGYSQRSKLGINNNPKTISLSWRNITEANADEMDDFLDARGGYENFDYTVSGESSSSKYICREWRKTIPFIGRANLQAVFEEVFEP